MLGVNALAFEVRVSTAELVTVAPLTPGPAYPVRGVVAAGSGPAPVGATDTPRGRARARLCGPDPCAVPEAAGTATPGRPDRTLLSGLVAPEVTPLTTPVVTRGSTVAAPVVIRRPPVTAVAVTALRPVTVATPPVAAVRATSTCGSGGSVGPGPTVLLIATGTGGSVAPSGRSAVGGGPGLVAAGIDAPVGTRAAGPTGAIRAAGAPAAGGRIPTGGAVAVTGALGPPTSTPPISVARRSSGAGSVTPAGPTETAAGVVSGCRSPSPSCITPRLTRLTPRRARPGRRAPTVTPVAICTRARPPGPVARATTPGCSAPRGARPGATAPGGAGAGGTGAGGTGAWGTASAAAGTGLAPLEAGALGPSNAFPVPPGRTSGLVAATLPADSAPGPTRAPGPIRAPPATSVITARTAAPGRIVTSGTIRGSSHKGASVPGTQEGPPPMARGLLLRNIPATSYSPRGNPPKYHRRMQA
jgi:hypothetical protein